MERRALRVSIVATTLLGVLGVAWGLVSGSQVILLDGIYGVIGIATTWLLIHASSAAAQGPTRTYPFGREAMTPLAIGIQSVVQLTTLGYAAAEAVFTILRGGSLVAAGPAILYSAIATTGAVAVWLWLRRVGRDSELLQSEALAWRLGAIRGVAMLAAFVLLLVVSGTALAWIGPFIDPVSVLVTCLLLVGPPLVLVRTTVGELLEVEAPPHVRGPVLEGVAAISSRFELDAPAVRIAKVGRKVYVEVEGTASPGVTIDQEDDVRRALRLELDRLPYDVWLTFELVPRSSAGATA